VTAADAPPAADEPSVADKLSATHEPSAADEPSAAEQPSPSKPQKATEEPTPAHFSAATGDSAAVRWAGFVHLERSPPRSQMGGDRGGTTVARSVVKATWHTATVGEAVVLVPTLYS